MKTVLSLKDVTRDEVVKKAFIRELLGLIDKHMAAMRGLKGLLVKQAYQALKAVRPTYIEDILSIMSSDFIEAFDGLHAKYREGLSLPAEELPSFAEYLDRHEEAYFEAFVQVSDFYANKRPDSFATKAYRAFRPELRPVVLNTRAEVAQIVECKTIVDVA